MPKGHPEKVEQAVSDVVNELQAAILKFRSFKNSHEGYAVVLEELDEAWDAIKANDHASARREMVQVAAMALRFIIDLEE